MRLRTYLRIEYLLKGAFLGFAALLVYRTHEVDQPVRVGLWAVGMATLALLVVRFASRGSAPHRGQWLAAGVLTLLENPTATYLGLLSGFVVGGYRSGWTAWEMGVAAGAGSLLGLIFFELLRLPRRWLRGIVAVLFVSGFAAAFFDLPIDLPEATLPRALAMAIAVVLFYVLTLAGKAEETELEIGLLCLGLALSLSQLGLPTPARSVVTIAPLGIFVVYCERIRRNLVGFKHALRGLGYEQQGRHRDALLWYRMAENVVPTLDLAREGSWRIHRRIDLGSLADDPDLRDLIDPRLCLDRVDSLLTTGNASPERWAEVEKLLDLVEHRRDDLPLVVARHRVRLWLARDEPIEANRIAEAKTALSPAEILATPDHEADALFGIWKLLVQDPQLVALGSIDRLGEEDGLLLLLIAIERRLRQWREDETAHALRTMLVRNHLTLSLYESFLERNPDPPPGWLDHAILLSVARDLAGEESQIDRAIELARIVELGLPERSLLNWAFLAQLQDRRDPEHAAEWRKRIRDLGLRLGSATLPDEQREAFHEAVRRLGEDARQAGDIDSAARHLELYADSPRAGLATLRTLSELHHRRGDALASIRAVERALAFTMEEEQRRGWAKAKARLYEEIEPTEVQARLTEAEKFFDFDYCFRKARRLFEEETAPTEVIHYLDLASLGGSRMLRGVNYLLGRARLREEDFAAAAECFEAVVAPGRQKLRGEDEEAAYYDSVRLLARICLDRLDQPQRAVDLLSEYERFRASGADTLFELGRAHEKLGQLAAARKWYDMVLVYPNHPRAASAREAIRRLTS